MLALICLVAFGQPAAPIDARVDSRDKIYDHRRAITNSIGMKLELVPSGEFLMGSPADDRESVDDEMPQHRVQIRRPFYLGATEVTRGQFRRVAAASGLTTRVERDGVGGNGWNAQTHQFDLGKPKYTWKYTGFEQTDDHPVVNITWIDAVAFCNALSKLEGRKPYYQFGAGVESAGDGYRLPTEAEWEYACRAGTTTPQAGGNDRKTLVELAKNAGRDEYYRFTAPVARFRPNGFGLYDMHDNVREWCWDVYTKDYYGISPLTDPIGPLQGRARVIRGGSWKFGRWRARPAFRWLGRPEVRDCDLGFRVTRDQLGSKTASDSNADGGRF